ncbi:MAG: hypothetical protein ABIV26_00665, partial [Candidatus Limnocylindrales bacterium]
LAPPSPIGECRGPAAAALHSTGGVSNVGSWWHLQATLDDNGALSGWDLEVGAPGTRRSIVALPAAATVSGPSRGRVVVAIEGSPSIVRIIRPAAGCKADLAIRDRIVRRAVADPHEPGLLAHLLEPGSRRDLGIWRITPDGTVAERVLEPLSAGTLAAAGMSEAWTTDLHLDPTGSHLAVQSCDPDRCLTRIVAIVSGAVTTVGGEGQGLYLGLSSVGMIAWAACGGLPCDVEAWDVATGAARIVASNVTGAAMSGDGRTLVVRRVGVDGAGPGHLESIDLASGRTAPLEGVAFDGRPLDVGAAAGAGIEGDGRSIGVADSRGYALNIAIDPEAYR